jgi:hypothetical protein
MAGRAIRTLVALGVVWALSPSCARSGPCRYNSDCNNSYCDNGTCKVDCVDATRDCPPGYVCNVNAQCAPPYDGGAPSDGGNEGGGGQDGGSDGPTTDTTPATDTGGPMDSSTQGDAAGPPGTLHELDRCSGSSQCASPLVCTALVQGGPTRCTRPCSSSADCMTGTVCLASSGGSKLCLGDHVGRVCTAASGCMFGCLTSPQYCTVPCTSGSDCPNGYGCMGVGSPATQVCVKAEAPCGAADTSACIAPAACDTSAALVVGGCTTTCTTAADCPQRAQPLAPWTCDSGGICRRPGDVYGPLAGGSTPAQYACNAMATVVNVCNDAQHMDFTQFTIPSPPAVNCSATTTTSGVAGDSCVDSCRYQGGCIYGFACAAVGNVGGSRIGLCLPAGSGEVGAACASSADCAFGYCDSTSMKCSRDCTADGVCPDGSSCVSAGGPTVEGLPFRKCQ